MSPSLVVVRRQVGRRDARRVGLEAVVRGRRGGRARVGQGTGATRRRRSVEQLVLGGDVALRIDGGRGQAARVGAGRVADGRHRRGRGADPRCGLGTQQHRSAARMVGDRQARRGTVAPALGRRCGDTVLADAQALEHAAQRVRRGIGDERGADVAPFSVSLTLFSGTERGTRTSTSASPPLIRSARLDSVRIEKAFGDGPSSRSSSSCRSSAWPPAAWAVPAVNTAGTAMDSAASKAQHIGHEFDRLACMKVFRWTVGVQTMQQSRIEATEEAI